MCACTHVILHIHLRFSWTHWSLSVAFFTTSVHNLRLGRQVICMHDHTEHKSGKHCCQIIFILHEELIWLPCHIWIFHTPFWLSITLYQNIFLCRLNYWVFHYPATSVVSDVTWVAAISIAAHKLVSLQGLFNDLREFSGQGWDCISQAIFAIPSKILFPLNFMFFSFFLISGWSLNVLTFREGQRVPLQPGPVCSEWSVSLYSQLFKSPVVLAMSSPTAFGDRSRAMTVAAKVPVTLIFPLEHLGDTTLILLGSDLGGLAEAAGVG